MLRLLLPIRSDESSTAVERGERGRGGGGGGMVSDLARSVL